MDTLEKCQACSRNYQTHDRKAGSLFRCVCGQVLKVSDKAVNMRDEAAVIACSSCGGTKQKGQEHCSYCGSAFQILEQDLKKICHSCHTRLPSKSKFCFHCGQSVQALEVLMEVEDSEICCPRCEESSLAPRKIGEQEHPVLECGTCAGMFIDHVTFTKIENNSKDMKIAEQSPSAQATQSHIHASKNYAQLDVHPNFKYLNCPCCQMQMSRRNYLRRSGVIIDSCREHGIWLDCFELEKIVTWLRSGELANWKQMQIAEKDVAKKIAAPVWIQEVEPPSLVELVLRLFRS